MTTQSSNNPLLGQLVGKSFDGVSLDGLGAIVPPQGAGEPAAHDDGERLDALVDRIRILAAPSCDAASDARQHAAQVALARAAAESRVNGFVPQEPASFQAAGLNDSLVEALALKYLLARGDSTGREVADQLKLPFVLIDGLLRG